MEKRGVVSHQVLAVLVLIGAAAVLSSFDQGITGHQVGGFKVCSDNDNDGYNGLLKGRVANCGTIDCDDNAPDVYPGATELCDGKDNNCDREIDEGCNDPNLIGHWKFDEGSGPTTVDSSGNGHTGIITGATWTTGQLGAALDFDSNDYVNVGDFDVIGNKMSIAAWIYPDSLTDSDDRIISKAFGTGEQDHYWMLSVINQNNVRLRLKTGGNTITHVCSSLTLLKNTWQHVAVTYDGTQVLFYVDGIQCIPDSGGSQSGTIDIAAQEVWVGRNPSDYGTFDGILDDVRIYDKDLTQEEVDALAGNTICGNTVCEQPGENNCNCPADCAVACGDGCTSGGETCDGDSLGCTDSNGYAGTQDCLSDCSGYDQCTSNEYCGDNIKNGPEVCDGDTVTCTTTNGYPGTQDCLSDCSGYDQCTTTLSCGDSVCTHPPENSNSCSGDCFCGDNVCDDTEDETSCAVDCSVDYCTSITQYEVTWTFDKPYQCGQFINGDWWIVGPIQLTSISPQTSGGRHGSMINPVAVPYQNPPKQSVQGYDDRITTYDPSLNIETQSFPFMVSPESSIVSAISRTSADINCDTNDDGTDDGVINIQNICTKLPYLRTASVLTVLSEIPPGDAFRPPYVGTNKPLYTKSQLRWDKLQSLPKPTTTLDITIFEKLYEKPHIYHMRRDEGIRAHPYQSMPSYYREGKMAYSRAGLLLHLDFTQAEKETLLIRFVQLGIDKYAVTTFGDSGGDRHMSPFPIIFAGMLLDDTDMQQVSSTYWDFHENKQTYFGTGWSGATALQKNFAGIEFEHLHPSQWSTDSYEVYRQCCKGEAWVGQALTIRLMGGVNIWSHDPFFAYMDRWMPGTPSSEDWAPYSAIVCTEWGFCWYHQGSSGDQFIDEMWALYR